MGAMDVSMVAAMCRPDEWAEVFEPREEPAQPARSSRHVDFASVPPSQWVVHDRLLNWARWARGGSGESARSEPAAPMFKFFRSTEAKRAYGEETSVPVDKDDALKVHFIIIHPKFDPQKRRALQWNYLDGRNPTRAAREMGVTMEALADLVRDARTLLLGWA